MAEQKKLNGILRRLESLGNPKAVEGMARFGINPQNTYGISIPDLRKLAKEIGKNHALAQGLWQSGIHEARILSSMVDEPRSVNERQMDKWAGDFDSWDVCDQVCMNLFEDTPFAYRKAAEWSRRKEEFVKRAGFVMMARLAVSDKTADDSAFTKFFPLIKEGAIDERNFVKKAVNWALRQIGKRNRSLRQEAMRLAREIQGIGSKSAKWIASDAIKELAAKAV